MVLGKNREHPLLIENKDFEGNGTEKNSRASSAYWNEHFEGNATRENNANILCLLKETPILNEMVLGNIRKSEESTIIN